MPTGLDGLAILPGVLAGRLQLKVSSKRSDSGAVLFESHPSGNSGLEHIAPIHGVKHSKEHSKIMKFKHLLVVRQGLYKNYHDLVPKCKLGIDCSQLVKSFDQNDVRQQEEAFEKKTKDAAAKLAAEEKAIMDSPSSAMSISDKSDEEEEEEKKGEEPTKTPKPRAQKKVNPNLIYDRLKKATDQSAMNPPRQSQLGLQSSKLANRLALMLYYNHLQDMLETIIKYGFDPKIPKSTKKGKEEMNEYFHLYMK